jgi:DNA-binding Xre family transcriptional regulator
VRADGRLAPEALRLPAEPLLAAVDQAAGDRGVSVSELLGNTGQKHYARARQADTVTLDQVERICDRLGCHPFELYGPAYQLLAIAAAPGPLEPEVTVTAWHQTACARPGCAQPIQPGEMVGLVGDVGPCCAPCCGLDRHWPQRAADTIANPPRKERAA